MPADRLAFLQRAGESLQPVSGQPLIAPNPSLRSVFGISGVAVEASAAASAAVDAATWRPPTARLLAALHTFAVPVVFTLHFGNGTVAVSVGTWASTPQRLGDRSEILRSLVAGAAPEVDLQEMPPAALREPAVGGFLLGIPSLSLPTPEDPVTGTDRLYRATIGRTWALTVVARPVAETDLLSLRTAALDEARDVHRMLQQKHIETPLAEQLTRALTAVIDSTTTGVGVGSWRTAAYLTASAADPAALPLAAGAVRGIYSGPQSMPEPLRVHPDDLADSLAMNWAMVDVAGRTPPGLVHRPYEYQTLLTSDQLSAFVHLPMQEHPGFGVRTRARFGSVAAGTPGPGSVRIGPVVNGTGPVATTVGGDFHVKLDDLTRHAFVPGVTGSGKTNTLLHLITQVRRQGVPFLIIEPVKTEYRCLLDPRLVPETTVYTMGREEIAPIRMNPFEVIPYRAGGQQEGGYDVIGHIDRLRALFVACFGLWNPLPAILERALHRIYADRGWDLRVGGNHRMMDPADASEAFPTLTELGRAAEDEILSLGYDQEVADNLRGALTVRINSLRLGAKGRMLDTRTGVPLDRLFTHPTVFELEGLGDEDDKAFLMGLLLIQLTAFRRSQGRAPGLTHLLVIEEAHRLLRNVAEKNAVDESNAAFKAVESFSNLLAEVRAYGQGVIVADQIPSDLAPTVLKNTNLKVVHRLVAEDDRHAVGTTMAMTREQIRDLAVLPRGRAAVYAEGEDTPLLVQVPRVQEHAELVPDSAVAATHPPATSDCPGDPELNGACCSHAERILATHTFRTAYARLAVAAMNGGTIKWDAEDVDDLLAEAITPGIPYHGFARCTLGRAATWFADRRGAQHGWPYTAAVTLTKHLQSLFDTEPTTPPQVEAVEAFRSAALAIHQRHTDPFPNCYRICPDNTCLYRGSVLDIVHKPSYTDDWAAANDAPDEDRLQTLWDAAYDAGITISGRDAGEPVRDGLHSATIRATLCYAQHAARALDTRPPTDQRDIITALINQYGIPNPPTPEAEMTHESSPVPVQQPNLQQ